jgi:hypothetical protein
VDEALFEKHLKLLENEGTWPYREWNEAIAYLKKAAEEKDDISRAVNVIEGLFQKCHHVDIITAAADTLVVHYLNVNDYDALSSLTKRRDSHNDIAEALCRYAEQGKVPSSAIYLLVESLAFSWISHYKIHDALAFYIGKDRDKMRAVLTLMNERSWLKKQIPACELCMFIPREYACSSEIDVPKEVQKLQPEMPITWSGIRRCPQCGNYYETSYAVEYESPTDGMSVGITIDIKRLSPPDALNILKDKDLDDLRQSYDGLIEKAVRLLEHPEKYLRDDAACTLTLHHLKRKNWKEIQSLLHHGEDNVRLTTLKMLGRGDLSMLAPLAGSLEEMLSDRSLEVKKEAACLLSHYYFHLRTLEKLIDLAGPDDPVMRGRVIHMIRSAPGADMRPFMAIIREALASKDESLRYEATCALTEATDRKIEVPQGIEALTTLLGHEKKKIRDRAASTLKIILRRIRDTAIPVLLALLADGQEGAAFALAQYGKMSRKNAQYIIAEIERADICNEKAEKILKMLKP